MEYIGTELRFPDVSQASEEGIVAIGIRIDATILKLAYSKGIFPWYNADEPVLWWCPPERMVVALPGFKFSKKLLKFYEKQNWTYTVNAAFGVVLQQCRQVVRKGQEGTWISEEIVDAYTKLHEEGLAWSVEVWEEGQLIGGLYGVDMGNGVFTGESMFSLVSGASKCAFIFLVQHLQEGNYRLLDCQVYNTYLDLLGASLMDRDSFLSYLH